MRQLREITDGASNVLMVGDVAGSFKAWGDPDNMRDPAAGFGTGPDQFCNPPSQAGVVRFLLADGSVRAIIDDETLKAIACPDDGRIIGQF